MRFEKGGTSRCYVQREECGRPIFATPYTTLEENRGLKFHILNKQTKHA